ncbi:MAG: FtsQ-type POTRA domain-containing protein [Oscillibacter sp.]|nr:FtsQ-type POTRA domain-containing protein [Oscillibacter sp.]
MHPERGYLSRAVSSLIVVVTVFAALIMFFRVKIVNITGAHRYSDAEILSVAGISDGQNMFLMNKYRMADKLIRELTYLEDVHISRDLPDTLIIDLKECVIPLAVAQDAACWLVSPSGKIVDRLDISAADQYAQITGCPILSPSVGTQIALPSDYLPQQRSLVQLLTALDTAQMLDDVDGIRLDNHSCILVDYGGRFTVKFPLDANYRFKLHALEVYINGEKIQDNMTGTFDLTRDDRNYFQQNVR